MTCMQMQRQCWPTIHKSFTWGTCKCGFNFTEPIWTISQQTQLNSYRFLLFVITYNIKIKWGNAWCEVDDRAKDIASDEFWVFNRQTHWEELLTRFHFQGKVLSEIWITFWTSIACKWKILLLEFEIILFVSTVYCFPFLLLCLTLTDCLWHVQS